MSLSIIVAASKNKVIGDSSVYPLWHLADDLANFKKLTLGHPIIMGRKTYENINHPLSGRENIVLSHNLNYQAEGCLMLNSLQAAINHTKDAPKTFIIGGGEIYKQGLTLVNEMYLTLIDSQIQGNVYFDYDPLEWKILKVTNYPKNLLNSANFSLLHLVRI